MPGPSSPKRKQKQQAAKEQAAKEKAAMREDVGDYSLPHDYVPADDSIVHTLSTVLTEEGKAWWNKFGGKGKAFDNQTGPRGDRKGARNWVRGKYVELWWTDIYPEAASASKEDRLWFFTSSGTGPKIYSYLNNWRNREHENNPGPPRSSKTPVPKLKTKAIPHDFWRRENMEVYEEAIRAWKNEHERTPNLGEVRAVSSKEFQKLPPEEQKKWKEKAEASLMASRALAKITDADERAKYVAGLLKALRELSKEAEEFAGVQMLTFLVHEKEDGKYHIGREVSEGLRGFGKSEPVGYTMTALERHIKKSAGLTIANPFPEPTMYPDYANGNIPRIPSFMGWALDELRHLYREYFKGMAVFQGFSGRFSWKEIRGSLSYYIDPKRFPFTEFDDPSYLSLPAILTTLQFIFACQTGKIPSELIFQWLRIPAGSGLVIHPSQSQETDREFVVRGGNKVTILVFGNTVTKCHQPDGKMKYEQSSIDFADFLAFGLAHARADTAPPAHWLQLPSAGPTIPKAVIFGTELERLRLWANLMPDSAKNRVLRLIDVTNEHQAHIPATHPKGVYLYSKVIPRILPQSVLNSSASDSTWPPACYFQPPGIAPPEGSVYYFEVFQQELRESDVIRHQPSKSYFGGETGIVRVVRALIQLYLGCCAARKDFRAPEDPPAGVDLSRFPLNEHDRIVAWIEAWILAIQEDIKILSETSSEREAGLVAVPVSSADDHEPHLQTPSSAPPAPTVSTAPSAPSAASKPKGKKRASLSDDEESRGEDVDYEGLDITPQDDDFDDNGLGPQQYNPPDDAYPPDDPLGLRERYHFNPAVPHKVVAEIGTEDEWVGIVDNPVFGGFPSLHTYIAPRLANVESVMRMLDGVVKEAKQSKARWNRFCVNNPRGTKKLFRDAAQFASRSAEHVRPLSYTQYLRKGLWTRACAMAPTVFAHWYSMSIILRESIPLLRTAEHMVEHRKFPDPELTSGLLAERIDETRRHVIFLDMYCAELMVYHELSSKHFAKWRAVGDEEGDIWTLAELSVIARTVVDWVEDTHRLAAKLKTERLRLWRKELGQEYEEQGDVVYIFGCPTRKEQPKGLEDAIIAQADNHATLSEEEEIDDNQTDAGTMAEAHSQFASQSVTPARSPAPSVPLVQMAGPLPKTLVVKPRPKPRPVPAPDVDSTSVADSAPAPEPTIARESTLAGDATPNPAEHPAEPAAVHERQVPDILISDSTSEGEPKRVGSTDMEVDVEQGSGEKLSEGRRSSEAPSLSSLQVLGNSVQSTPRSSIGPPVDKSTQEPPGDDSTPEPPADKSTQEVSSTGNAERKRKQGSGEDHEQEESSRPPKRSSPRLDAQKTAEKTPQKATGVTTRGAANAANATKATKPTKSSNAKTNPPRPRRR